MIVAHYDAQALDAAQAQHTAQAAPESLPADEPDLFSGSKDELVFE